ncbi:hypothetical protein A3J90_00195 [candidate division WOR-1 bacterium RIFOXYC2_FULL_37_10]|uniref:Uncharacterized protein n=1 Tax=candidate division WOR-1 bacterium RIFOXYB2_FULL_37_13 TaxID=1802579 RepID=A0A1F4SNI6_UNCSA|nr:MAG: hypothetical protein A2246_06230 [candidate division WOR-1 bacterium RIFOXYA2_FULL_37_7]OGC21263.1 MAG: hypothetical protein A2310_02395 [candidate division WOR-1 bacterium RIFOXYB2_FULL_37_13]OGC37284.1 MAG: hypothetical protein A3J90_00195 [candidate division WOR-1 bacterium RIFOXYC2_FULL_37_10]
MFRIPSIVREPGRERVALFKLRVEFWGMVKPAPKEGKASRHSKNRKAKAPAIFFANKQKYLIFLLLFINNIIDF